MRYALQHVPLHYSTMHCQLVMRQKASYLVHECPEGDSPPAWVPIHAVRVFVRDENLWLQGQGLFKLWDARIPHPKTQLGQVGQYSEGPVLRWAPNAIVYCGHKLP